MRSRNSAGIPARGRALLARAGAALLAVLVLVGVLRAGASYSYCPTMEMVTDAPCCPGDRHAEHQEAAGSPQLRARDCCEKHVVGKLPSVDGIGATPHVLPPALVAVTASSAAALDRAGTSTRPRIAHDGRAGPIAMARHRAALMVSLD